MRIIKNKNGVRGANTVRNHADAIRVEELARVIAWSEKECPVADIEDLVFTDLADNVCANESVRVMQMATAQASPSVAVIKHVLMRAFMSTGFTLWTRCSQPFATRGNSGYSPSAAPHTIRNFELCRLRGSDLTMGCVSKDLLPYFKVTLVNWKGWQKSTEHDNDLQSESPALLCSVPRAAEFHVRPNVRNIPAGCVCYGHVHAPTALDSPVGTFSWPQAQARRLCLSIYCTKWCSASRLRDTV